MADTLALIGCSQLVTLQGPAGPRTGAAMRQLRIIPDGALIARNGRIERTGERSRIEPLIPKDAAVIDAGGRIVLPGFIDAHTHPVFAGNRADEFERRIAGETYQQIASAGGGILSTVRRTRAASEEELTAQAKRHVEWFLRGGTTTVEAKSGYGLSLEDELKILRVIRRLNREMPVRFVPTFLGMHTVPPEYAGRRQEYARLVESEMLPAVARESLAEYCDVFCEEGAFSVEDSRRVLGAARRLGLQTRIHADQLSLSGGALLAAELGAATADHLECVDEAGIAALRESGVQPVLLPGSVYALGTGRYAPARQMIEAGLAVVLATDCNPGSSPTPSVPMILSLACTQMKMTPAEAITAVTIHAAHSLGRGHEIGTLEPGKRADFVIHDCADYRELAYYFGVEHAARVFIDGAEVFNRHRLTQCLPDSLPLQVPEA